MVPLWVRSPLFRLAGVLPLALALLVTVLFVPLYQEAVEDIRAETDSAILIELVGLRERFSVQGRSGLIEAIRQRIATPLDDDAAYLLTDSAGQKLAGNLPSWPRDARSVNQGVFEIAQRDGGTLRGSIFLLTDGSRLLVSRLSPEANFSAHIIRRLVIAGVAATLLSAFLTWVFARSIQHLLSGLARGAEQVQGGALSYRLPVSVRGDSLDELATRFNVAFARIEQLMDAAREVSSAIAHDIRRPLSRLRNEIEQLGHDYAADPGLAARLDVLLEQTDGLLRSFAAMLRLARLESGSLEAERKEIELDGVVKDVAELFEPVAEAAGRHVHLRALPTVVTGDRELLFQALINLLENATHHGGGDIELDMRHDNGNVVVTVRDHGRGVPEEALGHLFERFFRVDSSRGNPAGSGVGLTLVEAIAQFHGGKAAAENASPGLRVTLYLPRKRES